MIEYTCAKCGAVMSSPESLAGCPEACPNCGAATTVGCGEGGTLREEIAREAGGGESPAGEYDLEMLGTLRELRDEVRRMREWNEGAGRSIAEKIHREIRSIGWLLLLWFVIMAVFMARSC